MLDWAIWVILLILEVTTMKQSVCIMRVWQSREIGDRRGEADSLSNLGNIADVRGDYDEAERFIMQVWQSGRNGKLVTLSKGKRFNASLTINQSGSNYS